MKIEDGNKIIFCDSLFFDIEKDKIELLGQVSINNGNQIITSPKEVWIIKMKKLHS